MTGFCDTAEKILEVDLSRSVGFKTTNRPALIYIPKSEVNIAIMSAHGSAYFANLAGWTWPSVAGVSDILFSSLAMWRSFVDWCSGLSTRNLNSCFGLRLVFDDLFDVRISNHIAENLRHISVRIPKTPDGDNLDAPTDSCHGLYIFFVRQSTADRLEPPCNGSHNLMDV